MVHKFFTLSPDAWRTRIQSGEIYGTFGELECSEDGSRVICPFCGGEYKTLSRSHIQRHGLDSADQVRELMGLNRNQPLASKEHSALRSRQVTEMDLARHIRPYREFEFSQGFDERRHKKYRAQFGKQISQVLLQKSRDNEARRGTKTKKTNQRLIGQAGHFVLFNAYYFFSKRHRGKRVTISIVDNMIVANLTEDPSIKRTYKKKYTK